MLTPISEEALSDPEAVARYVDQVIHHVVAEGYHNPQQMARAIDNILTDSGIHVLSSFAVDIQDSDHDRHWDCRVKVLAARREILVQALVPHPAVSQTPPEWYVRLDKIEQLRGRFGTSAFPVKKPRWLLGLIPLALSRGWLSIEPWGSCLCVFWTSFEDAHYPLSGPAIAVDFDRVNGVPQSAYKTAISLHKVLYAREQDAIVAQIKALIDTAHASHFA